MALAGVVSVVVTDAKTNCRSRVMHDSRSDPHCFSLSEGFWSVPMIVA